MKCESGKTEGLRAKGRVDALWESAHLVWNAKVRSAGCAGKKQNAKHLPLFERDPAPCQTGEKTHAAVVERGEKVVEHGVRCSCDPHSACLRPVSVLGGRDELPQCSLLAG